MEASLAALDPTIEIPAPGQSRGRQRPLLFTQLVLLNAIVCGLEFCASAAFTYIPPMLLKSGIEEQHMSIILGVGPLLGFFLVPVIGRASDKCQSRYGRRRPYIFVLSMLLLVSLIVIPYGEIFGTYVFGYSGSSKTCGVILLIFGAILLDFTSQACLTPCEALLSDACKNTNQQDRCFTIYSAMCSLGGCIGYLITALDWNSSSVGLYFGGQEKSAFSVLVVLFTFSMFATLCVANEQPLEAADAFEIQSRLDEIHQTIVRQKEFDNVVGIGDAGYETSSNQSLSEDHVYTNGLSSVKAHYLDNKDYHDSSRVNLGTVEKACNRCDIPRQIQRFSECNPCSNIFWERLYWMLPHSLRFFFHIPCVLKRLAIANFFSWTAIMCFNLFFTDFVGQAVYGGNPNSPDSDVRERYDAGVRMGSWGLFLHCITSALYAPLLEQLVQRYGSRTMYFWGMFSFTLAMAMMVFTRHYVLVTMMAACTGFGFATVTIIPFTLVTSYQESREVYFYDVTPAGGVVQNRGVGSDLAILDSAYFLAQVVLSACMGYIVFLTGTVLSYMVCACGVATIACACIMRIIFSKQQMTTMMRNERTRVL